MGINSINLRKLFLAVLVVVSLLILAGCASTATPAPSSTAAPTSIPTSTTVSPPAATSRAPSPSTSATASATTSASPSTASFTVNVSTKSDLGNYLVDGTGKTLYYFTRDIVGKSNATSAIIMIWPIFNATSIMVPLSLNTADFGTITRDDGQKQTTYKGYPLYYFANDQGPGDTSGQGINGIWFVINPASFPPTPTAAPSPAASASPSPSAAASPPPTTSAAPARGGY
jgi:predicted lipoprotein with Yx(FWY)xxD motif